MAWPEMFPEFLRLHFKVYFLVFASYTLYHASRKTFINVKTNISSYEEINATFPNGTSIFLNTKQAILVWGTLDSVFFLSYTVGLYIIEIIGQWINLRWAMGLGMCFSAIVHVCFDTLTKMPPFYNKWFYFFMWALIGLLEATGWPCLVAIVEIGFDIVGDGFIFGLWSACASLGNLLGACIAPLLIQYNYKYTFWVTAAIQFTAGLIILFTLWLSPKESVVRYPNYRNYFQEQERAHQQEEEVEEEEDNNKEEIQLMGPFQHENYHIEFNEEHAEIKVNEFHGDGNGQIIALLDYDFQDIGGDRDYMYPPPPLFYDVTNLMGIFHPLAFVSINLAKYLLFLWLPFYLNTSYGSGEVPVCEGSVWYDLQQIVTGTFQGYLSNLGQKTYVLTMCTLMTMASLIGYNHGSTNKVLSAVLMLVTGLLIGRPREVMVSTVYNQASIHEQRQGTKEALNVIASFMNRTISMGTTVDQYLISLFYNQLGWMGPYYFWVLLVGSNILVLSLLLVLREIKDFFQKRPTHPLRE